MPDQPPIDSAGPGDKPARPAFAEREPTAEGEYRYDAFISYRHVEPDRAWAKWLATSLETYRTPKHLVKERGVPARISRCFRDEDELPASADLSAEIETALADSRFLIVVCSPNTPESEWVNREVVRFREMGRHNQILAVLIDGEPSESFPRALMEIRRTLVDSEGLVRDEIEEIEPLAADVRSSRDESARYLKRAARLRLLACILGVRYDDLARRDQQRQIRRLATAGAVMTLLLVVMGLLTSWAFYQRSEARQQRQVAQQERNVADQQRRRADQEKEEAQRQRKAAADQRDVARRETTRAQQYLYSMRIGLVQRTWRQGDLVKTRELLRQNTPAPGRVDHRGWEWRYFQRQVESCVIGDLKSAINSMDYSADGKLLAMAPWGGNDRVVLWDMKTRKITKLSGSGIASVVRFSRDGKLLCAGCFDGSMTLWSTPGMRKLASAAKHLSRIESAAFSDDSKMLVAVGGKDGRGELSILDVSAKKPRRKFTRTGEVFTAVAISPDGKTIAAATMVRDWSRKWGGPIKSVQILLLRPGESLKLISTIRAGRSKIDSLAFSPDGNYLACDQAGSDDHSAMLWDVRRGVLARKLTGHADEVQAVAFSPDGRTLATSGADNVTRLWNVSTGMMKGICRGHMDDIRAIAFSPDGKTLASGGYDSKVRIWPISSPPWRELNPVLLKRHTPRLATFSPDGKTLVTAGGRAQGVAADIRLWDVASGLIRKALNGHTSWIHGLAISPDGKTLASTSNDKTLRTWDLASGRQLLKVETEHSVGRVAYCPKGKLLATSKGAGGATIRNAQTGEQIGSVPATAAKSGTSSGVTFSHDGAMLAVASGGPEVSVYDMRLKRVIRKITASGPILSLEFSPDGSVLAAAVYGAEGSTTRGRLFVWNTADWSLRASLKAHTTRLDIAFSHDGRTLASCALGDFEPDAGPGGEVKLWHVATCSELLTFQLGGAGANCVKFSPDGKTLTAVNDREDGNRVRLWYASETGKRK